MSKQTKNIITKESIADDLLFYTTADIRVSLVCGGVSSLIGIPFISLLATAFKPTDGHPISFIFYGLVLLIFSLLLILCPFTPILISLKERKRIRNGEFEIVVLPLRYKSEVYRNRHFELRLHFDNFKEYEVSATEYALASAKQEYYIVHYRNSKRIRKIFATERYEYQDQNQN